MAKFGIALEWGSRGLEFESQHSDQKSQVLRSFAKTCDFFIVFSACQTHRIAPYNTVAATVVYADLVRNLRDVPPRNTQSGNELAHSGLLRGLLFHATSLPPLLSLLLRYII